MEKACYVSADVNGISDYSRINCPMVVHLPNQEDGAWLCLSA